MISAEQRRYEQLYAYRAGMLNSGWIAGVARNISAREGYIQQSNNLNQLIHFTVGEGSTMPTWVRDGCNLKIVARILSARNNNEPVISLRALAFEAPSIYDMPPRTAWERTLRPTVPRDAVRPETFRPDDADMRVDGSRVSDTGNIVKLAGFVSSYFVEPAGVPRDDGKVSSGCLVLTIRQTADAEDLIPVRCHGPNPESLARRLTVGAPLKLQGKIRVRLKNTGEAPDTDGVLPVHRYPYLHVSTLSVANREDIREEPEWAKDMVRDHLSKRAARAAQKKEKSDGQPSAAPAESVPATAAVAKPVAPTGPAKVDTDLQVDPAILKMLGS